MIKTVEEVSYDPIDLNKKAIVYAQIVATNRNDINETYTLTINEWVEISYTENVPIYDENDVEIGLEQQTFTNRKAVRTTQRVMSFVDADNLTNYLDSIFTITETGTQRRKRYTILGHLLINNTENVRNTQWELV